VDEGERFRGEDVSRNDEEDGDSEVTTGEEGSYHGHGGEEPIIAKSYTRSPSVLGV
jgi:hypothetical protein